MWPRCRAVWAATCSRHQRTGRPCDPRPPGARRPGRKGARRQDPASRLRSVRRATSSRRPGLRCELGVAVAGRRPAANHLPDPEVLRARHVGGEHRQGVGRVLPIPCWQRQPVQRLDREPGNQLSHLGSQVVDALAVRRQLGRHRSLLGKSVPGGLTARPTRACCVPYGCRADRATNSAMVAGGRPNSQLSTRGLPQKPCRS
jgi:hypothetical protein